MQPVTVRDIQVEAKLRRPRGTTLAVSLSILCLSFRAVKENLGQIRLGKNLVLRNIEAGTLSFLRHERSEKIYRVSLTSNPASLLGKFQPFEADRHGG